MKKILIVLLSFLLLSGCTQGKEVISSNISYTSELINFETKDKIDLKSDNEQFDEFIKDFTIESLKKMDFITSTSFINKPENFGLSEKTGGMESISYEFDKETYDFYLSYLEKLKIFDYNDLSKAQQYLYDSLEYSLYETLASLENYRYDLAFSKRNDLIANTFFTLADIDLNSEQRVISYLETIATLDDYFKSLIDYTKKQYEEGIYTSDEALDYSISMIESILSKGDNNSLILTFNNRLAELKEVKDSQKYIEQNYDLVMNELFPYLKEMIEELKALKGREQTYTYELSDEYKDMLYALNCSTNDSLTDILNLLIDTYNDILEKAQNALENPSSLERLQVYYDDPLFQLDEKEMLELIYEKSKDYYADIGEINFKVSYFDDSLKDTNIMAYYKAYQLDNTKNNIIMVNPRTKKESDAYYYGQTISHEGIAGHMYIYSYYANKGIEENALMLSYTAYDEGMAMYAEYLLPYIMGYEDVADIVAYDAISDYLIDSIFDIMINYFGYDEKYMADNFGVSTYSYNYYKEYPAVLTRYGVGFAYIYKYLNMTKEALEEDFNYVKFNEMLMSDGPLPFTILDKKVEDYILNKGE